MTHPINLNEPLKPAKKTDFLANARVGWGAALPDWVETLALAANGSSATDVAKRLGYSTAVVSSVCHGSYKGDLTRVADKVRGVFMGAIVDCPVMGEVGRAICLDEQKKKHFGTSALRTRLYRTCPSCEHALTAKKQEAAHG